MKLNRIEEREKERIELFGVDNCSLNYLLTEKGCRVMEQRNCRLETRDYEIEWVYLKDDKVLK